MNNLEKIREYWNTRSEGYRQQVEKEREEHKDEFYKEYFRQIPEGSKVLDIGCGPGFFSLLLASLGLKVTAADYSEGMLEKSKDLLNRNGYHNVEFCRADAQHLPFADASFDAVVSRNLVWNLEDPGAAYKEWLRVLKPGGKLFVFDGNHYCYLFNEDYASIQPKVNESSNHVLLGVKTNVIDDIARELPLSRQVRPQWDEDILSRLKAAEAPHRLEKLIDELSEAVPADRKITIARELTKKFEQIDSLYSPDLHEWLSHNPPKGEYVIVVDAASASTEETLTEEDRQWIDELIPLLPAGQHSSIASKISRFPKKIIYNYIVSKKNSQATVD